MRFNSRTPTINERMWVRGMLLLGARMLPVARCARACEGASASRWSRRHDNVSKIFQVHITSDMWGAASPWWGPAHPPEPSVIRPIIIPSSPPGRTAPPPPPSLCPVPATVPARVCAPLCCGFCPPLTGFGLVGGGGGGVGGGGGGGGGTIVRRRDKALGRVLLPLLWLLPLLLV